MPHKIISAQLCWNNKGEPYSELFDDVYFTSDNELEQARDVFISHNNLEQRWQQCHQTFYVIAETGFGCGLNFLATCQAFESFQRENPTHQLKHLYFISFEKHPLILADLKSVHQRWPQLTPYANHLQQRYPQAVAGCHRLNFEVGHGEVILDLWLGDITETLPQVSSPAHGLIDTWFLDGFSPSKNPAMWHDSLYLKMAKITKDQANLTTFSATADVQTGLQRHGFSINKVKGLGNKPQILTASFSRRHANSTTPSWYYRPPGQAIKEVTIVGGGIASAALCLALAKRGINITLVCSDSELALGASGNRQGGFYPLINSQHDYLSQLYSQAFFYTRQTLLPLRAQGYAFSGEFCGVLQLAYQDKLRQRFEKIISNGAFPNEFVHMLDPIQASQVAGVSVPHQALYYPDGAWLSPREITMALIEKAKTLTSIKITFDTTVDKFEYVDQQWQLETNQGQLIASHLILANGHQLTKFKQTKNLALYQTSGQVSHIDTTRELRSLKTVLCYQGYLTPEHQEQHCIGASFERDKVNDNLTECEQHENISKLLDCTNSSAWAQSITPTAIMGKVGIRLSAKDHLPMVGAIPNAQQTAIDYHDLRRGKPATKYQNAPHYPNLYLLGALGSRGLCSATYLAEILACQLTGQPQPISQALLNQLNPNRYWIKQLKAGHEI